MTGYLRVPGPAVRQVEVTAHPGREAQVSGSEVADPMAPAARKHRWMDAGIQFPFSSFLCFGPHSIGRCCHIRGVSFPLS